MDFIELTIDGLMDTSAITSAFSEAELRKIQLLGPHTTLKKVPRPAFQVRVTNGHLETPSATVELQFEVGDILFKERFIVMTKFTSPLLGLLFYQTNSTILDMRQGVFFIPFFCMQLKHADNPYSIINKPLVNLTDILIQPV